MRGSAPATPKQNSTLFKFTLLKFWESETPPPPTLAEASEMLDCMFQWMRAEGGDSKSALKSRIIEKVRRYFPDWDGASLAPRFGGGRKRRGAHDANGGSLPLDDHTPKPDQDATKDAGQDQPKPDQDAGQDQPKPDQETGATRDNGAGWRKRAI